MIDGSRKRMRSVFVRAITRVRRAFSAPTTPNLVQFPFKHYKLVKLLRHTSSYSPQTKVLSEETIYMSPAGKNPFTFHIKILVRAAVDARREESHTVVAKLIGDGVGDVEKEHVYHHMEREIIMYTSVLPLVNSFHMGWSPVKVRYLDLFPQCYGAALSMINEFADKPDRTAAILLKNISFDGFMKIMKPCSSAQSELIVKRLALLHAAPIGMCAQMYLQYAGNVDNRMRQIKDFRDSLDLVGEQARLSNAISGHPILDTYREVIFYHLEKYAKNLHKTNRRVITPWTTICHSSCSIRKIMCKPENENSFENVKFLGTRYLQIDSCASDIIFFMLTSTTDHVLSSLFDVLLITYFDEFKRAVSSFYVEIPDYNFQNFKIEFESKIECNIGRVLFEIGRIYTGEKYNFKMMNLLLFMLSKNWLKPQ